MKERIWNMFIFFWHCFKPIIVNPFASQKIFCNFCRRFCCFESKKMLGQSEHVFLFELFIALGSAANFHFLKAIWNSFARPVFRCVPDPVGCHRMIPSRSRCLESPPSDAIEGSKITPYGPMILEPWQAINLEPWKFGYKSPGVV